MTLIVMWMGGCAWWRKPIILGSWAVKSTKHTSRRSYAPETDGRWSHSILPLISVCSSPHKHIWVSDSLRAMLEDIGIPGVLTWINQCATFWVWGMREFSREWNLPQYQAQEAFWIKFDDLHSGCPSLIIASKASGKTCFKTEHRAVNTLIEVHSVLCSLSLASTGTGTRLSRLKSWHWHSHQ
jgi:hypothetical protein